MRYGTAAPWGLGSLWGVDSGTGPAEFCQLADERVLVQMDDAGGNRKFRDLICDFAEGFGHFSDVAFDVQDGFDLSTAVGVQLDMIGAVIGLPRQGFPDDRYRVFLEIQTELVLSAAREDGNWTGTGNNILRICRKFIGPAAGTINLINLPPYDFRLSIPGITIEELEILANFICVALYAGVLGRVIFIVGADSLWDSVAVGPIPDGGIWGSSSVVVSPSAVWNYSFPIGSQPCE
jgi:hypothetical protein